jgi:hypothetical protein
MTRSRDVADTQDNLGGAVTPFVAGKNFVINGGFDIFQRGSLSTTSGGYGLDRWYQESSGSGAAVTMTQQTTGVPSGSRYCARITTPNLPSAGYGNQSQFIETSNVAGLWGKTVTLSIKLRRNAAFAGTLTVSLAKSATVDAGNGATWTTLSSQTVTNAQLPTGTTSADWYTVSFTTSVPSDGTANGLRLSIQQSQVESSAYWEMAQAQLEIGSAATPFARAGGSIGGELALCQRYFWQAFSNLSYASIAPTNYDNSGVALATMQFPVTMRVAPTLVATTGTGYFNWRAYNGTTVANQSINSGFSTDISTTTACAFYIGSLTTFAGGSGRFIVGNSSATLGFSAEL